MSATNFMRRAAATLAAAICVAGASSAAAAPAPFSPAERALIEPTLGDCADGPGSTTAGLGDAALRAALLRRARLDLGQRVKPAEIDRFWSLEPQRRDVEAELEAARQGGNLARWIADLRPRYPGYVALAAACRSYAALAQGGGWEALPEGGVLREGDRDGQVPLLRLRLAREGFAPATAEDPELFDATLVEAVTTFQRLRGLEADGVVGPRTREALNVSAEARLAQIQANLERWRWLPRTLPADRVMVDAGGAFATLYLGGAVSLQMRAVVGDPQHRTPMFASRIESIVFNPPWLVPTSIATNELWPKERRNPGYLARNNIRYVDGRLIQSPGPKNSLGVVKFDLPSPFGVYLHDTPAKSAFDRVDRHLSHGCMRLQKPRELAAALLQPQGGTAETVEQAIAGGETTRVHLGRTVPLYVVYWTAVAEPDGKVDFRPDVYGWDEKLLAALDRDRASAATFGLRAAMSRSATDCMETSG